MTVPFCTYGYADRFESIKREKALLGHFVGICPAAAALLIFTDRISTADEEIYDV